MRFSAGEHMLGSGRRVCFVQLQELSFHSVLSRSLALAGVDTGLAATLEFQRIVLHGEIGWRDELRCLIAAWALPTKS